MSDSGFEPGLDDASQAGVFFVADEDLDTLTVVGRDAGLSVRRIDLSGCDKGASCIEPSSARDMVEPCVPLSGICDKQTHCDEPSAYESPELVGENLPRGAPSPRRARDRPPRAPPRRPPSS